MSEQEEIEVTGNKKTGLSSPPGDSFLSKISSGVSSKLPSEMPPMVSSALKRSSSVAKVFFGVFTKTLRTMGIVLLLAVVVGAVFAAMYVLKQDERVTRQFEGKRWSLPARVFARPLELYEGKNLFVKDLEKELQLLGYKKTVDTSASGRYTQTGNSFIIHTRGFQFAEDLEPERLIHIVLANTGKIISLKNENSDAPLSLMRLEPILIGNFYPAHNEDRVLVQLSEVPPLLTEGLVAIEDRNYYNHFGVNPVSIIRAMVANFKSGKKVQGGSTLTQQLVKNYFLSNERSYKRKMNEAIMAILLELHYSKDEVLEAYMNEIYLGQNGKRGIHGFGMASQFYFGVPLRELDSSQIALLIGIAKGASYHNPRRFPERAKKRRDLVLSVMAREGVMSAEQAQEAKLLPLSVSKSRPARKTPFPAYLELVKAQLRRDYKDEELHNEGLIIFTPMDPIIQLQSEQVVRSRVRKLERAKKIPTDKLNAAMVISNVQDGEVLAIVGGTDPRLEGFNRALTAKRQIGSVVKPVVYLTALERSPEFSLATRISDAPVTVKVGKKLWKPENYDHRDWGGVLMGKALIFSRNTPTVRVGIQTGLDHVIELMQDLGVHSDIPAYPSALLGASELAPIEVQQMYQTLASEGTYTPLRGIRSVMNAYGETLKRYPLEVKQVASPESIYLITYAMSQITRIGTAKYLSSVLPVWKNSAGKTGTTNDKRDSWYAGFTGQHVVTVWVGRDDNQPTPLTGASGALRVWADMVHLLPTKPFKPKTPPGIRWIRVDEESGLLYNHACGNSISLPFNKNNIPKKKRRCAPAKATPPPPTNTPVWQGLG